MVADDCQVAKPECGDDNGEGNQWHQELAQDGLIRHHAVQRSPVEREEAGDQEQDKRPPADSGRRKDRGLDGGRRGTLPVRSVDRGGHGHHLPRRRWHDTSRRLHAHCTATKVIPLGPKVHASRRPLVTVS